MFYEDLYEKGTAYLSEKDPILAGVIKKIGPLDITHRENYFLSLVRAIIGQQLSVTVASVIYARFEALFMDQMITPQAVLAVPDQTLRDIGNSWAKIKYLKALSEYAINSDKVFEQFDSLSDEEIITELTQVKGIGKWTAEMFLIFTMHRPDIYSYGDLGLRRAIQKLYGFKKEPSDKQIKKISDVWKPYRSVASRYLWKSLSNEPK